MLREFPCNLCRQNDAKVIFPSTVEPGLDNQPAYACTNEGHGEYYQIIQCRKCGQRYSSPREDASTLEEEYQNVKDEIYREEISGRIKTFERNLKNISWYKKDGNLMDVGCSMGVFLSLARDRGWNAQGIEPSFWCITEARKLFSVEIIQGTHENLLKFSKEFDVVTLWDVLEHLDDPLQALKNCHQALKDDGILALSTLNSTSPYARILGKNDPG